MWLYLTYLRLSCDHSVSFVQRFGVQSLLDFFIINISYFSISKYLNKIHLQDTGQDIWHLNNWFSFFNLMSNRSYLPQLSQMKMILTFDYRLQRCTPCWGKLHGQDNFWCEVSLDICLLTAVARSMVVAQLSVQCPCAQYSTVQCPLRDSPRHRHLCCTVPRDNQTLAHRHLQYLQYPQYLQYLQYQQYLWIRCLFKL